MPHFFTFRVSRSQRPLQGPPLGGERFSVEAILDGRPFARFVVDVGQGDELLHQVEWVTGRADLAFAGLPPVRLAIYPLAEHFAEKLHAYTRPRQNPSRVKDLLDMALILELGLETTPRLTETIRATFERYDTHPLPETLPPPPEDWLEPFQAMAEEAGLEPSDALTWHERIASFLAKLPT